MLNRLHGGGGYPKVCEASLRRTGGGLFQRFFFLSAGFRRLRIGARSKRLVVSMVNRAARGWIEDLFSAPPGGGQKSAVFRSRTGWATTRIFARVSQIFFWARPRPSLENRREIQGGGGVGR